MKVLVIGRGGREHAIAWKIAQSALVEQVFVAPGNDGIGQQFTTVPIDEKDNAALVKWSKENAIGLVIIGPEAALQNGLADELTQHGIFQALGQLWHTRIIQNRNQHLVWH